MLDKLEQLRNSITEQQRKELKVAAGDKLYQLLEATLASETEEIAKERLDELTKVISAKPVKAFALYEGLTSQQKDLVESLVDI